MASGINTFLYPTDQSGVFGCGSNAASEFLDSGEKTTLFQIPISGITDFSIGESYAVYLTEENKLISVGINADGQCGQGDFSSPVASGFMITGAVPFSDATQVNCGQAHTVTLDGVGDIYGCGHGPSGALDLGGSPTSKSSLVPILTFGVTTKILASENFTIGTRTDTKGIGVGENNHGQLGVGDTSNKTSWLFLGGGSAITGITDIGIGKDFSFIIKSGGKTVWGAGRNSEGQLGIANTTQQTSFVQVSGISGVKKVVGGRTHSLFLLKNGTVYSCGSNSDGQLGTNFGPDQTSPIQVSGLPSGISDIAAGDNISYALTSGGIIYAWGNNISGAIGQGTSSGTFGTPTIMVRGSGFNKIESYPNANAMMAFGPRYDDVGPTFYIQGPLLASDQINYYINGYDNINDNINCFVDALDVENDNINLFLNNLGIADNIEFFIEGNPTVNIGLYINGYDSISSGINLFTNSVGVSNNNINIFMHGHEVASGDLTFFIKSDQSWSAYVKVVENNPNDNISLFIYGGQSGAPIVSYTNDSFNLYVENDSSNPFIDFTVPAFVSVASGEITNDYSDTWTSFVKVGNTSNNNFTIFIHGHPSGSDPFGISNSGNFNIFIQGLGDVGSDGFVSQTGVFDGFVRVNTGLIDQINFAISGFSFPTNNIDYFIFGVSGIENDNLSLFINGYNDIDDSIYLTTFGILGTESGTFNLYLETVTIGLNNDSLTTYIHGF